MNHSELYNFCGKTLLAAHAWQGIILWESDQRWIEIIFHWLDVVDGYLDSKELCSLVWAQEEIITLMTTWEIVNSKMPTRVRDAAITIRSFLLVRNAGELQTFIRLLKTAFRISWVMKHTTDAQEYFRNTTIEWRICWTLIAMWLDNKGWTKLLREFGSVGNIADDLLDHRKDYRVWEKKIPPSLTFYSTWIKYLVREILNKEKHLLKFLLSKHSTEIWKKFISNELGWLTVWIQK